MSNLPWTIYLSFLGAMCAWFAGGRSPRSARVIALVTALATTALTLAAAASFDPAANGGALQAVASRFHLAVDGISMTLLLLTGVAAVAGILFSWNVSHRQRDFFALFLALVGGVYGVFLSADALLLFVFYEIAIVPKYFLVAVWGSKNSEYAAMKLVLYSFAGSALVMAALVWAYAATGSFDIATLIARGGALPGGTQAGLFALAFTGFAVLAGMFPFHTWAPAGHAAAPTGASMLLAGVVMKLGAYGCLRVAIPAFPEGFALFQPAIAALAIVGIVYAGLAALAQTDFKLVVGYSSVSHMGFVLLGLAAATPFARCGAVLQMFSHGIVAGLLFAVVGRMVYERTHTRNLNALRRLPLHRLLPFAAAVFVLAGLASMGMPGFSGFPAELSILIGVWEHSRAWAVLAALGIPVAAAFTLRAVAMAFFGCSRGGAREAEEARPAAFPPITWPEKTGALLLLGVSVLVGLKPGLLLDWISPAIHSPLMQIPAKTVTSVTAGGAR
jgi:NADH-quinone oxidoreductase subunit M